MTAAQRATLEELERDKAGCVKSARSFLPHLVDTFAQQRDALRAALGTCGTCQHADPYESRSDFVSCAAPITDVPFPFRYQSMPVGERCTRWTAKEDA